MPKIRIVQWNTDVDSGRHWKSYILWTSIGGCIEIPVVHGVRILLFLLQIVVCATELIAARHSIVPSLDKRLGTNAALLFHFRKCDFQIGRRSWVWFLCFPLSQDSLLYGPNNGADSAGASGFSRKDLFGHGLAWWMWLTCQVTHQRMCQFLPFFVGVLVAFFSVGGVILMISFWWT